MTYIYHPNFKPCKICGTNFPSHGNSIYCYLPSCPSHLFNGHKHGRHVQSIYHAEEGKSACKIVVCSKIDSVRDFLANNAWSLTTVPSLLPDLQQIIRDCIMEDFNAMRRTYLSAHCHEYHHRIGLAAGLFYIAASKLKITRISVINIANILSKHGFKVTETTIRKYSKMVKKSFQKT